MTYNLPDRVLKDIIAAAQKCGIETIILFGSRARGTHRERSDIDLAVRGGNFDEFYWIINETAWSLLSFDIVEMDRGISYDLEKELTKDGVVIYEKT
ncbi:MAG: nucleotidyltransferase domain-containing protein [Firmicutes bacterium]|nr:nucleotidyltransferase domain-containing protein [Bacillota bacterium]